MTPSADAGPLISVAIPRPIEGLFTYRLSPEQASEVCLGGWVRVPFGKTRTHAYVVELPRPGDQIPAGLSPEAIRLVEEVGPVSSALPPEVLELCRWTADFYQTPLGEVLSSAAPAAVLGLKNALGARDLRDERFVDPKVNALTEEQKNAVQKIQESKKPILLHGVTGSGKTEVYLELARQSVAEGKGVLVLLPEISLTPQLERRFRESLGCPVVLWHSALPDGQRRDAYAAVKAGHVPVVIGARSAVFSPIKNLGLVLVDEEHDPTYKQEERARYQARDLAVVRAHKAKAKIVLGSATPSLESLERVREGRYEVVHLTQRFSQGGDPKIERIDLKTEPLVLETQSVLAERTLTAIRETLADGQQVLVYLNRRGFSSFLLCEDCARVSECPQCSVSLTVYKKNRGLRCHWCDHREEIPDQCAGCQGDRLKAVGLGTEGLEEDLTRLLPDVKLDRLDRDQVTSAKRLGQILDRFRSGETQVLVGTQMLVKGHDFPGVTLVVVMLADGLFRWPDFRAAERGLQILTQVSGRAGRGEKSGRVLVQTYDPEHPVLKTLCGENSVSSYLENEREIRQALSYPPFGRLARLRLEDPDAAVLAKRMNELARYIEQNAAQQGSVQILGPSEALQERVRGAYRWDILIKTKDIQNLHAACRLAREICAKQRWSFSLDVDPYSA